MKILLSQRLPCVPALTGAAKSALHLLQGLAERRHACRIVALESADERADPLVRVRISCGVEIHAAADGYHLWTHLAEQIRQFEPDCVFVGEDRTFLGLATALQEAGRDRVVYLAQSQATLPFGPESFLPDAAKTEMLGRAAGVVAPSRYVQDYMHRWSGLAAEVIPPSGYGCAPFADFGNFDRGFVTLVNASQLKGICILEELARLRPDVAFAAVPTWATTTADLERLHALRNVRLLPPSENIHEILANTRVLVVPSLWGEAFGRIVVEAMLCGIPVLASNIGGLPEAKLGIDYLLPVQPIRGYSTERDDRGLPLPVVPPQDVAPWADTLDRVLSDRAHYIELSRASRAAAIDYVSSLTLAPYEDLLQRLAARRMAQPSSPVGATPHEHPTTLSRERLELLGALVTERTKSHPSAGE